MAKTPAKEKKKENKINDRDGAQKVKICSDSVFWCFVFMPEIKLLRETTLALIWMYRISSQLYKQLLQLQKENLKTALNWKRHLFAVTRRIFDNLASICLKDKRKILLVAWNYGFTEKSLYPNMLPSKPTVYYLAVSCCFFMFIFQTSKWR